MTPVGAKRKKIFIFVKCSNVKEVNIKVSAVITQTIHNEFQDVLQTLALLKESFVTGERQGQQKSMAIS